MDFETLVKDRTEALSLLRALQVAMDPQRPPGQQPALPLMKHEYEACEKVVDRLVGGMNAGKV